MSDYELTSEAIELLFDLPSEGFGYVDGGSSKTASLELLEFSQLVAAEWLQSNDKFQAKLTESGRYFVATWKKLMSLQPDENIHTVAQVEEMVQRDRSCEQYLEGSSEDIYDQGMLRGEQLLRARLMATLEKAPA